MIKWQTTISFLVTMIAVTNVFGNLAIFISLTSDRIKEEQQKIALQAAFACGVIFLVVIWMGDSLLDFLSITVASFQIAGGLVLTLLGLSMMRPKRNAVDENSNSQQSIAERSSLAVVPIAMPIIAGPATITSILVNIHQFPTLTAKLYMSLGCILIAGFIALLLYYAIPISKLIGEVGLIVAERIMGLILIAMAMGMITSGLAASFPGLLMAAH